MRTLSQTVALTCLLLGSPGFAHAQAAGETERSAEALSSPTDKEPASALQSAEEGHVQVAESAAVPGSTVDADASREPRVEEEAAAPGELEGMVLVDEQGRASLRVGFMAQLRGVLRGGQNLETQGGPAFRVARTYLSGHVWDPRLRWFFQAEFAPTGGQPAARLIDVEVDYELAEAFSLRLGQFRTPTGRQWMAPLFALQFADRNMVSNYFRAGRDLGLEAGGTILSDWISYRAGLFNGNGENNPQRVDDEYLLAGRLELHPWGTFATETPSFSDRKRGVIVGAIANRQQGHVGATETGARYAQSTIGLDMTFHFGRVFATAEGYYRHRDNEMSDEFEALGSFVQGGVYVMPELFELASRIGYARSLGGATSDVTSGEFSANLYPMENHFKLNASYTLNYVRGAGALFDDSLEEGINHLGLVQFQVFL